MISIGYVSPGKVATKFHECVVDLLLQDDRVTRRHSLQGGPRISSHRNEIVRDFLKTGNTWLFMVDTDMTFEADVVEKFLQAANPSIRPVIGGLCFGGGHVGVPFPTIYTLVDPAKNAGKVTRVVTNYPKDALCKVDATGAAALFIHRDALLEVEKEFGQTHDGYPNPHPWFMESIYKGKEFGEDWTFCMRLKQLKIPLYVHTGIKFGHMKTQNFNEEYYEYRRKHD